MSMSIAMGARGTRMAAVALATLALVAGGVPAEARRPMSPAGDEVVRKVVPSRIHIATWEQTGTCITGAGLWFALAAGATGYELEYHDSGNLVTGFAPPFNAPDESGLPEGMAQRGIAGVFGGAPCGPRADEMAYYKNRFVGETRVRALFPAGTGFIKGTIKVIDCHLGADKCKPARPFMGATVVATRKTKRSTSTSGTDGTYLMAVVPGSYSLRPVPFPGWTWVQSSRTLFVTKNTTSFANFTLRIPPGALPPTRDKGITPPIDRPPQFGLFGDTPCAGPDRALISCWRFEGDLADAVGGNDGTAVGGVAYADGAVRKGVNIGQGAAVQVPDDDSLDTAAGGRMTVSAWVLRTADNNVQHVVGKRSGCDSGDFPWQLSFGDGKTGFGTSLGGSDFALADGTPPMDVWQHLVGTQDGDTFRLYVDGELAGKEAGSLAPPDVSPLRIGGAGTCATFGGRIDEVLLWSRALSDDEVAGVYRANATCDGKPGAPRRLGPVDGARGVDPSPTLDWTAEGCATNYKLEVRLGTKTGQQVVDKAGIKVSEATAKLSAGKTFWWRASACNADGCSTGAWSSFKTAG